MKILGVYEHKKTLDIYFYLGQLEGVDILWNDADCSYDFLSRDELVFKDEIWGDTPSLPIFPDNIKIGSKVRLLTGSIVEVVGIIPIFLPYNNEFSFIIVNEDGQLETVGSSSFETQPIINWEKLNNSFHFR